jgi:hypothetical protein
MPLLLRGDNHWYHLNHLDSRDLNLTPATPRVIEKALSSNTLSDGINAVLYGTDDNSYVFAGSEFYDVSLEKSFAITDLWGRSRNPIVDQQTIDAAFVGRDGITYVFSGEWFVQYEDTSSYVGQTVAYPPRRISSKFSGLTNVALAYVFKEQTYLFERHDQAGNFHYLRYSKDSYERADVGYPASGSEGFWQIPSSYLLEGFDNIDTIFVHQDNLIFIADQQFISFDLRSESWGYPRELDLIYSGIPFNKTDFKTLKTGFVGADQKTYFFSDNCYVSFDEGAAWTELANIKDDWGLQANIFANGVDATYISPDGVTYLFAGSNYVRYTPEDNESATYRYVDEQYPKKIATYLTEEADFEFIPKEFQQHLDEVEALNDGGAYFNGMVHNGRCVYVFTRDSLFTGAADKYQQYSIDGLGSVPNNFTDGGNVDAAFVDAANQLTYLFSGEQYIRYSGDDYRYMDDGYPKIIANNLAQDLSLAAELPESFLDGFDAAFYLSSVGVVLFNDQDYIAIDEGSSNIGLTDAVWGKIDNNFNSEDTSIDGAYVDDFGALLVFKGQQFVRYSDSQDLFALNPYHEPRYVDSEYPQNITEQWPQLDTGILPVAGGIATVFRFEDQVYFHTDTDFVTYELDLSDRYENNPVQVLAYRWGQWSDYLLSDIHAISRFKDLGQRFNNGDLSLTQFVKGSLGDVKEPYMAFAAIFGFEKEDVRWVKQRNAFLPSKVNVIEQDFKLELVLRLYDILATAQRMRVDVSSLYNHVWTPLYGSLAADRLQTAANGAYNVLVQVGCDNNYEVLVSQITDELNVIKRDALVPYVIHAENSDDTDGAVTTTRGLYQKLLIDISMASCAKTSRIKEATAAIQLYLHRCLINLEDVSHDISDQEAAREQLKSRWEWLQNYRVWEANRKVFLYPENYIRPELRDINSKSTGFEALEESLTQGDLTEGKIEASYFKFLDAFTEASELSIAGGYVYDEGNDKKLLVLGRTRTDPIRYYYRFGTFVGGASNAAIWQPWDALDIPIEATRVEPVFAFNRVFIFWTTSEEVTAAEDASAGSVTVSDDEPQRVNSSNNSTYEAKIYYSFYNLNKQWTQPQSMQTQFKGHSKLKSSRPFSQVELFVENTTKLATYNEAYENIYIGVRYRLYGTGHYAYAAYHLAPELYSVEATAQSIQNSGADLFDILFPHEGGIEDENVVMLNYNANSVDGPCMLSTQTFTTLIQIAVSTPRPTISVSAMC